MCAVLCRSGLRCVVLRHVSCYVMLWRWAFVSLCGPWLADLLCCAVCCVALLPRGLSCRVVLCCPVLLAVCAVCCHVVVVCCAVWFSGAPSLLVGTHSTILSHV